jgi:outer membrane lipoprotein-sorting protein
MLPRDASARRLSAIKLAFDTRTGHWISFEIVTREGSSILNEFRHVEINPKIDKQIFEFDLTGYKVTDESD